MLPWPSSPRRSLSVGKRHASEAICRTRSECRSASRAARSGTCSRRQQVEDAAILAARCSRRTARFPAGRPAAGCRRNRGTAAGRDRRPPDCAGAATGSAKFVVSASRARIREHPPHLRSSTAGSLQSPALGRVSSSSSGMLLQRKNDSREASSRSLIRYAVPRRERSRVAFDAEQELGAGQKRAQRHLDARLEAARSRAALCRVELAAAPRGPRRSPAAGRRGARASR